MTVHEQSMAQVYGDLIDLDYDRDVAPLYGIDPEAPPTEEEKQGDDVPE